MAELRDVFSEYTRMRDNGLEAKAVLHALRAWIEPLPKPDREKLAQMLREWEASMTATRAKLATKESPSVSAPPVSKSASPDTSPTKPQQIIRKIGSLNQPPPPPKEEVELGELKGNFDTRALVDEGSRVAEDFFGPDSVLLLQVRGTQHVFEVRPQLNQHEIVIGRSAENSAMSPDVDLETLEGAEMGVSRLHLALRYDAATQALHVYDLGSANGSYVNNQRLRAQEVRFLRDGDQVRLGKLVIVTRFQHPEKS